MIEDRRPQRRLFPTRSAPGTLTEEKPMPRAWKLALTALFLVPAAGRSSEPAVQPKPSEIEKLRTDLDAKLDTRFDELKRLMDLAVQNMRGVQNSVVDVKRDLASMERRLGELERAGSVRDSELQLLRDQVDGMRR